MGYLPFLLQVALFWWTPSTVAKKRYISPYINRGGGLEYFQNKDKMGKFYPHVCLVKRNSCTYGPNGSCR